MPSTSSRPLALLALLTACEPVGDEAVSHEAFDSGRFADGAPVAPHQGAPSPPLAHHAGWLEEVKGGIAAHSRIIVPEGNDYVAALPVVAGTARFDERGLRLGEEDTPLELRLARWGRGGLEEGIEPVSPQLGDCISDILPSGACARRLEYAHDGLTAWWTARDAGVQFGFDVPEAPPGDGALWFALEIEGAEWMDQMGEGGELVAANGTTWWLSGALAWDAQGTPLPAWLQLEEDVVWVGVDPEGAVYPITVDPVLDTATSTLNGANSFDYFGVSVAGAGDVDGDGYDDIIVGAEDYDSGSSSNVGAAYIYHGSATGVSTTASQTIVGGATSDYLGTSVAGAGDVDADGYADIIAGAPGYDGTDSDCGAAYIHHGSSTGIVSTPALTIEGPGAKAALGTSVAGAGDVNADGYDDIVVGAHRSSSSATYGGAAFVHLGSSTGIQSTASQSFYGATWTDYLGTSVAGAGDVNGDGYDDIIVGATGVDDGSTSNVGAGYVYFGTATGVVTSASQTMLGVASSESFGEVVSGAGDVDGDGYDDVMIGASEAADGSASDAGAVYVYMGSATGPSSTADLTLTGVTGSNWFGCDLGGAGDVDADGYDDIIVGANYASAGGLKYSGAAYIFLGSATGLASTAATTLAGAKSKGYFGDAVAGAGDVNGDGHDDVVVGAHHENGSASLSGTAMVFHGTADADGDGVYVGGDSSTDQDCDDDDSSVGVASTWYVDSDGDGYGDASATSEACDQPTGYVDNDEDCDDSDASVNPGQTEICDASDTDEDCSGDADDDDSGLDTSTTTTWYLDSDNDDYGDASTTITQCEQPTHYVADGTDCDDDDRDINPGETEVCDTDDTDEDCSGAADDSDAGVDSSTYTTFYADSDGDGYGDTANTVDQCDAPSGYLDDPGASGAGDCDDSDASVNPSATEVCDADDTDEDCSGAADDSDAGVDTSTYSTFYTDADADGYGDASSPVEQCDASSTAVDDDTDCDDSDASVNPSATEVCDADDTDEDCSGDADDSDAGVDASTFSTFYADADGDGFGDASSTVEQCDLPSGYLSDDSDCDDTDAAINPDATEVCDASDTDEDCSGAADDSDAGVDASTFSTFYADADGDGFGDASSTVEQCELPSGYLSDDTDCDDTDAAINPDATEICDASDTDEDCSGAADDSDAGVDASTFSTFYADADGDGFGDASSTVEQCELPSGYLSDDSDCDDTDAAINPDATEVCDASDTDEDCSGAADDSDAGVDASTFSTFYADADGDGFGDASSTVEQCELPSGYLSDDSDCDDTDAAINPDATEVCDASDTDEDCSGAADDDDEGVDSDTFGTWYTDADGDGFGDIANPVEQCEQPEDAVSDSSDCDDDDPAAFPGATEIEDDGVDQDCDGEDLLSDDDAVAEEEGKGSSCSTAPVAGSGRAAGLWLLALPGLVFLRRRT